MNCPNPIEIYFRAEKVESLIFVLLGLGAVALSGWLLWQHRTSLSVGLAIPLVLIGLIQLTVGTTVYCRTDHQMAQLQQLHAAAPTQFRVEEDARMAIVNRNFDVNKLVEIAFILIGTGLLFLL